MSRRSSPSGRPRKAKSANRVAAGKKAAKSNPYLRFWREFHKLNPTATVSDAGAEYRKLYGQHGAAAAKKRAAPKSSASKAKARKRSAAKSSAAKKSASKKSSAAKKSASKKSSAAKKSAAKKRSAKKRGAKKAAKMEC